MKKNLALLFLLLCTRTQAQVNINLLSQFNYNDSSLHSIVTLSNLWGYVDETGKEYALVGTDHGTSIVDVSDPVHPAEVFFAPGATSIWREIKTYNNHAYVTTEGVGDGLLIIDLNPLPGPLSAANITHFYGTVPQNFGRAHTLFIDEAGVLYLNGTNNGYGGVMMFDLAADALNPPNLGEFDYSYVHDCYARGDTLYSCHMSEGYFIMTDMSNPVLPDVLAVQDTPFNFPHNCWLSQDGNYLFTTDEKDGAYIAAFDISDPTNVQEVDRTKRPGPVAPHNTYWHNHYLVTAYFRDGITIHDVTDPWNMVETGHYDTSPLSGGGLTGAWGVYPYLPSGIILASDMAEGLFILAPDYTRAARVQGHVTNVHTGANIILADVSVTGTALLEQTNLAGFYATGMPVPGNYEVNFTAANYYPKSVPVDLYADSTLVLDIALKPKPAAIASGTVKNALSGGPVGNAKVVIEKGAYTGNVVTGSAGVFNLAPFSADTSDYLFDVRVGGVWGLHDFCDSQVYINKTTPPLQIELEPGYYDDFAFELPWTTTGTTSTSGAWVRAAPYASFSSGAVPSNPGTDVHTDCHNMAYVTGNMHNVLADANDVDGGISVLGSPAFNVSSMSDPYLSVDVWMNNADGSGTPNDTLGLWLKQGGTEILLDKFHIHNFPQHEWTTRSYRIKDFASGNVLSLVVKATDHSPEHVLDAAIDRFMVTDGYTGMTAKDEEKESIRIYPNPASHNITISSTAVLGWVQVTDMTGKTVMSKNVNDFNVVMDLSLLQKGVYCITATDVHGHVSSARMVKQ